MRNMTKANNNQGSEIRKGVTRRRFLTVAASAAAAPMFLPASARGANDRITLGFIGVGKQGQYHVGHLARNPDVHITAVCDVDRMSRDQAAQRVRDAYGGDGKGPQTYMDYRELLGRDDVDAVLISTPDHWHAAPVIDAAAAGKDIYCEKPLSLTIDEAWKMVDAIRRHACVFQTGSMQRSYGNFRYACELVRSGYIGALKEVIVNIGGPPRPCDLPAEPVPEGLEWDMWLGPAPARPFNAVLRPPHNDSFPNWRAYRDYSGGGMTDWGAHHFDIAQWGMGMDGGGPIEIIPPDGEDHDALTFIYANGVKMYRPEHDGVRPNGVLFIGGEGRIEVNRGHLRSWPDSIARVQLKPGDVHLYDSPDHHRDWFGAIRSRRRPICDVEIGASSVTVCHLGNLAYWLDRPLKWDPQIRRFPGDREANRMLARASREPWGR